MAINEYGIPLRIPALKAGETLGTRYRQQEVPVARFRRTRRFARAARNVIVRTVRRTAPARTVVVQAPRAAARRVGRFARAVGGRAKAGGKGKVLMAVVETGTAWGAGALAGAAEGLTLTDGEKKALPCARRGLAVGLNYAAELWGGRGGKLVMAAANGIAGSDGAATVGRRSDAAAKKK